MIEQVLSSAPQVGLYARITWLDSNSKRCERQRKTLSGTTREARRLITEMLGELDDQREKTIDASKLTFSALADYFKTHYAKPAEYDVAGIKKAGMRAYKDTQNKLVVLVHYLVPPRSAALLTETWIFSKRSGCELQPHEKLARVRSPASIVN